MVFKLVIKWISFTDFDLQVIGVIYLQIRVLYENIYYKFVIKPTKTTNFW